MFLQVFPLEIVEIIKIFMWGNNNIYKEKLKIVKNLPEYKKDNLRVTVSCRMNGKDIEIEDELYCPRCGEKTLFPFTRHLCWDCNNFI